MKFLSFLILIVCMSSCMHNQHYSNINDEDSICIILNDSDKRKVSYVEIDTIYLYSTPIFYRTIDNYEVNIHNILNEDEGIKRDFYNELIFIKPTLIKKLKNKHNDSIYIDSHNNVIDITYYSTKEQIEEVKKVLSKHI